MKTSLTRLRDSYPSLFVGTEQDWLRRVSAYWQKLRRFDSDLVDLACDNAVDRYPDKMPTVGQLVNLCNEILSERKKRDAEEQQVSERIRTERENAESVEFLRSEIIPHDDAGQRRYVDEGDSPFERLARTWEVQSKRNDLDPNSSSPPELFRHRMSQLWETWAETENHEPQPPTQTTNTGDAGKADAGL